jgi:glycosyltransferase involved in cell wall biosynthesis
MGISYWGVAHGVEAWSITNPVLKIALRQADKILAVSHYTGNRMYDVQNLSPQQIQILPNTFSAQQFTPAAKPSYLLQDYGLHHDQNIILTVARLSKSEGYKGYDRIIQALPKIRLAIPSVHYLLVGKGDDQSRIEHLIEQLDLQHHVTLIGFVPDEQLCAHYNLCDVFAMPSKGEGFGIVYLEAMACGKPCLGGNQDGALDALVQGELGVLVNPDDIDEIAQALIQILQGEYPNALLYQPERLRQAVIEHFGFEIFQQQLCEYLQDFLAA